MSRASKTNERGVSVRVAKPEDREAIRGIVRRLHEKTIFGHMPFSDEKFDKHADRVLSGPLHMAAFVAEYQGRIIGFIWATVGQHTVCDEGLIATCHVIAVETELFTKTGKISRKKPGIGHLTRRAATFLRLLKAVQLWAKTRGADHVMVHITTGGMEDEALTRSSQRLLAKIGSTHIGGAYVV